ncbi:MAG: hypothetical protein LBR10_06765 [Prevotellaceae bacterium]|jgi:hypothetical protein|nr:hypothetical protein [Prevotellaceae bacterium]
MIYSFIIKTVQTNFIREYHIPSEYSLYDFRRFIENDLDFDDSQQGIFFVLSNSGARVESYSLFDMGNGAMDTVILEDLINKGKKKMLYTFDCFNDRSLFIDFKGEVEALPRTRYPVVVFRTGDPPGQFVENMFDSELLKIAEEIKNNEESSDYDDEYTE